MNVCDPCSMLNNQVGIWKVGFALKLNIKRTDIFIITDISIHEDSVCLHFQILTFPIKRFYTSNPHLMLYLFLGTLLFVAIKNGVFCLLLNIVCDKYLYWIAIEFCLLILYPETLLNCLFSFNIFVNIVCFIDNHLIWMTRVYLFLSATVTMEMPQSHSRSLWWLDPISCHVSFFLPPHSLL